MKSYVMTKKPIKPISNFKELSPRQRKNGDLWVVYSPNKRAILIYRGTETRDVVRQAYAKEQKVHINKTRSRRLKNTPEKFNPKTIQRSDRA